MGRRGNTHPTLVSEDEDAAIAQPPARVGVVHDHERRIVSGEDNKRSTCHFVVWKGRECCLLSFERLLLLLLAREKCEGVKRESKGYSG